MKDYYKILGLTKSASDEEIKKAYRKLAHQYHPDKPTGNEGKFKEINEAYQVLSDKNRRNQYDRFGTAEPFGSTGAGFDPSGAGFNWNVNFDPSSMHGFGDAGDLRDIFDSFFEDMGFQPKRKVYNRGSDLELSYAITLEEAYTGKTVAVPLKTFVQCQSCSGAGMQPGSSLNQCQTCAGAGEVREQKRTFFGQFSQVKQCSSCHGHGTVPEKPCKSCNGAGRIAGEKNVSVRIVPGIDTNQIIKIAGGGEAGQRGGEPGDLYVRVSIKSYAHFTRQGDDLVIKKEISVFDILLERPISIRDVMGKDVSFVVPHGFSVREPYRIRGAGMPRFGTSGHGDLLVEIDLRMGHKLSAKQKKQLEDLGF